jgi:PTH2 family peptidyl-tRNA hydrolase
MLLYAIVRGDLHMPAGKMSAQAGHAFLEAFQHANSELQHDYRHDHSIGTKIVLQSKSLNDLLWAEQQCFLQKIPHALIVDSGHVMPPYFDGTPVVTALGIGPVKRGSIDLITKRFRLA